MTSVKSWWIMASFWMSPIFRIFLLKWIFFEKLSELIVWIEFRWRIEKLMRHAEIVCRTFVKIILPQNFVDFFKSVPYCIRQKDKVQDINRVALKAPIIVERICPRICFSFQRKAPNTITLNHHDDIDCNDTKNSKNHDASLSRIIEENSKIFEL